MAQLRIYSEIVDQETKLELSDWYGSDHGVSYKDIVDFLDKMSEDDNEIELLIFCPGGQCIDGWAIYDKLRNSGKNISATIEGECSSMATILLLAAPKERRFGYENARMCIHNPAVDYVDLGVPDRLTAQDLSKMQAKLSAQTASLIEEQNRILDLYVERTGSDRDTLQALMNEDKYIDMEKAKELGFISDTVAPNTALKARKKNINKKNSTMEDKKVTVGSKLLSKALKALGLAKIEDIANLTLDQKITAADGTEFTVERDEGDPQVGDKAYPNGTYTLDDGTEIVVENEVITAVNKPDDGNDGSGDGSDGEGGDGTDINEGNKGADDKDTTIATLAAQVSSLTTENANLKAENATLKEENSNLKAEKDNLSTENTNLQAEKDDLTKSQKTDEETAILDIVGNAGGKKWLDTVCKMRSTYHAGNRHFAPHGDKSGQSMSKTKQMLAKAKADNEAKRAAMD